MTPELLAGLIFLMVVALVLGPYYLLVVRSEAATQDLLRTRIRTGGSGGVVREAGASLLKEVERLSAIGPLNKALAGSNAVAASLRTAIQRTGLKISAGTIVLASASLALFGYVLLFKWTGRPWAGAAGVLAGVIPYLLLKWLGAKRLNKFEEQFPEAVDLIARTLRAGHAFPTGLKMAADELPQPVATEFKLLHDQQNYGMPLDDALRDLARRVPLIDARFFVTAVLTQRDAGGNLAEVLDNLSGVIRERFKIKRQLRVISAHGRLTGAVLTCLPPMLAAFMLIRMPENFRILIEDPLGIKMIVGALALQVLGAFIIYKITNVEY